MPWPALPPAVMPLAPAPPFSLEPVKAFFSGNIGSAVDPTFMPMCAPRPRAALGALSREARLAQVHHDDGDAQHGVPRPEYALPVRHSRRPHRRYVNYGPCSAAAERQCTMQLQPVRTGWVRAAFSRARMRMVPGRCMCRARRALAGALVAGAVVPRRRRAAAGRAGGAACDAELCSLYTERTSQRERLRRAHDTPTRECRHRRRHRADKQADKRI